MNRPSDFKKGDRVQYCDKFIPQNGVVSSVNHLYVFVKYDNAMCVMTTGDEPYTAQATNPEDLVKL